MDFNATHFWHLICINFLQWCRLCTFLCFLEKNFIKFAADLAPKLIKIMQKQRLLMVLFGTNFVSKLIPEHKKGTIFNAIVGSYSCLSEEKMIYLPNAVIALIMLTVGLFKNTRDLLLNRWTKTLTNSTLS